MIEIQVKYDDRQLQAALRLLRRSARDLRPAMREIAGHLEDSVAESFQREASPAGKWAPLDDLTIRDRLRKGYGAGPKLQRSGDLANRITSAWDDDSAVAGSNLIYAATHQFGSARRGIPARPFLAVWPEHRDLIKQEVVQHLSRAVHG